MDSKLPISVIIPTYNCGALLLNALDSVLRQTYPPSEIIVIDDGSTDGTERVIDSYADEDRIRYMKKDNGGVASARNLGLQMARYDWIAFLDADDQWLPVRLENGIAVIRQASHIKWAGGAYLEESSEGKRVERNLSASGRELLVDGCWFRNFFQVVEQHALFHTSTMLIHRSCFDEVGTFNQSLQRREDLDLWVRIAFRYPEVGYSADPLFVYMRRANSLTSSIKGMGSIEIVEWLRSLTADCNVFEAEWLPYAQYHAARAFKIWLHNGDKESLRYLVAEFPGWLPREYLKVGRMVTCCPSAIVSMLAFILRWRLKIPGKRGDPESFLKVTRKVLLTEE